MKHERFEIEPRPAAVGGGWRLRLIGRDLETGGEIELGGGVFPVEPKTKGTPTLTPCKPAKNGWMMMLQTLNLCPITEYYKVPQLEQYKELRGRKTASRLSP